MTTRGAARDEGGATASRGTRVPWGWLAALAAAIALHAVVGSGLVGGRGIASDETGEPPTAVLATRTIPPAAPPPTAVAPARVEPVPVAPAATPDAPPSRREPARAPATTPGAAAASAAASATSAVATAPIEPASSPMPAATASGDAASASATPVAAVAMAAPTADAAEPAASGLPPILAAGDAPPPVYRVQLPPPAVWHYDVRRGFFRGTGEIRWRPATDGASYRLELEARVGGLVLLRQSSTGAVDGNGIAPERFVDQRARRSAIAATFDRAEGKVTFSAVTRSLPLYPGTQDRLSWLVQLAAIARAEPALLAAGGQVDMVVIGARGDASVWSFRSQGVEAVDTVAGPVRAVKLVRSPRGAWDSGAQVWLDPERGHAPVHATLRNAQGQVEYDLLLERIDPLP